MRDNAETESQTEKHRPGLSWTAPGNRPPEYPPDGLPLPEAGLAARLPLPLRPHGVAVVMPDVFCDLLGGEKNHARLMRLIDPDIAIREGGELRGDPDDECGLKVADYKEALDGEYSRRVHPFAERVDNLLLCPDMRRFLAGYLPLDSDGNHQPIDEISIFRSRLNRLEQGGHVGFHYDFHTGSRYRSGPTLVIVRTDNYSGGVFEVDSRTGSKRAVVRVGPPAGSLFIASTELGHHVTTVRAPNSVVEPAIAIHYFDGTIDVPEGAPMILGAPSQSSPERRTVGKPGLRDTAVFFVTTDNGRNKAFEFHNATTMQRQNSRHQC